MVKRKPSYAKWFNIGRGMWRSPCGRWTVRRYRSSGWTLLLDGEGLMNYRTLRAAQAATRRAVMQRLMNVSDLRLPVGMLSFCYDLIELHDAREFRYRNGRLSFRVGRP